MNTIKITEKRYGRDMCKLVLDRGNFADFTSVSNVFIDQYMPKANGEFIKIYLHLLRLGSNRMNASFDNISTEEIADKFNMLESDVIRALNYWKKLGLLSFSLSDGGVLSKENSDMTSARGHAVLAKASGETVSSPVPEASGTVIPVKKKYTAKEIASFSGDERLAQLTFLAQTYLGKTLNPSEINSILYMLDGLSLDVDLIEYIMESCISGNHKSLSYMEKKAVEYVKKGISTISEAKADEKLRRAIFQSIYNIFGLEPKAPVKKEVDYVVKWSDEYGFSDELILEACNRTMQHTHTGSFQYTDTILTNWFNQSATSMEAIEKLDAVHSRKMEETFKPKVSPKKHIKKVQTFDQRTYDYDDLELKLLAARDKKLAASKKKDETNVKKED